MISADRVLPIITKNEKHADEFLKEIREINDILNNAMHISTDVPMLLKGAAALLQNHILYIEFHQRLELENNISRLWIVIQGERQLLPLLCGRRVLRRRRSDERTTDHHPRIFAIIDRLRKRKNYATPEYQPRVAVLIPAYNEEKVIVRTIRSVMMSNYKNIRIIVIDDGSKDNTFDVARDAYPADIASGRLHRTDQTQRRQSRRAELRPQTDDEEYYIGSSTDGVIAHDAITNLVPHFANPKIGAVAGNAKVGQPRRPGPPLAGARIHHEPELRAAGPWTSFDVVMVVPGAIGAWRTGCRSKTGGGYHSNTVAEAA